MGLQGEVMRVKRDEGQTGGLFPTHELRGGGKEREGRGKVTEGLGRKASYGYVRPKKLIEIETGRREESTRPLRVGNRYPNKLAVRV